AGLTWRIRLHQRIQRRTAYAAIARTASLSRQLQSSRQSESDPRNPNRLSVRKHDCGGVDPELEQGWRRRSNDEPARRRIEAQSPLPATRIEARRRSGIQGGLERSQDRDGTAIREGGGGRSGGDRSVRRSALLQQPEGVVLST